MKSVTALKGVSY